MADSYKNFAYSTVDTAPSPATTGTSLVVAAGEGARFPTVPFNAVIWPDGENPLSTNAEIVRVTAIATDTLTITREQEGTTARTVGIGDQISAPITAKTFTEDFLPISGGAVTGLTEFDTTVQFKGRRPWVDARHSDFNLAGSTVTTTGSVSASSDQLTVAATTSFLVGHGIYIVLDDNSVIERTITAIVGSVFTLSSVAPSAATTKAVGHSDTVALQAWLDFFSASAGGLGILPSGIYNISQIKIRSATTITGSGRTTILKSIPGNTSDFMFKNNAATDTGIKVSDLTIDGNKSASPAPTCGGVSFDHTGQTGDRIHRFANLFIANCEGDGFDIANAARACHFTNLYILDCDGVGFHVGTGAATDNLFYGVVVGKSGLHNFLLESGANSFFGCTSFEAGQVDASTSGDNYHITGDGNIFTGCKSLDAKRDGVHVDGGDRNVIGITCDTNERDHFRHTSGTHNWIRGACQTSTRLTADSVLNFIAGTFCNIEIDYDPISIGAVPPVIGAGLGDGSNRIVVRNGGGLDIVAYAASITPDPYAADTILVTSITGNLTINNTTYKHPGQVLKFILTQDGTGGHTISFGADYDLDGYTPITSPNGISRVGFIYDGTKWRRG